MTKSKVRLQLGTKIEAVVFEINNDKSLVVDIAGSLVRVANHSLKQFSKGDRLFLYVNSVEPLKLSLSKNKNEINIVI